MKYLELVEYVHGPYTHKKSGRKIINLQMKDGRWRPVSYPKFLVEVVVGRELDPKLETVDHINRDFHDNDWKNMRIVDNRTHSAEDAVRAQMLELTCALCGGKFARPYRYLRAGLARKRAGPFCSNVCAGRYGMYAKTNKLVHPLPHYHQWGQYIGVQPKYYTLTKGGETIADLAQRLNIDLPTEDQILAALPQRKRKPRPKPLPKRRCSVCGTSTENTKYCSTRCCGADNYKIKWPAKEKLQRLVWKYPTSYIANRLGVSDVAVAKHCKKYGVEKPPRGYWTKKRAKEQ